MPRGILALVFRCEVIDGQAHTTSEARELAWLATNELADRMSTAYSVRLLDALDRDASPNVRAHDGTVLVD
jgi:8-oxo-dGTP diphosphatase